MTTFDIMREIAQERDRQILKGYDAAHDDQHTHREIIAAPGWGVVDRLAAMFVSDADYRERLVEAAAQIIAEIERVDRANAEQEG